MKRLRTKVVASIVAVLILFCSLPMGSVIALQKPGSGVSITFKANPDATYMDVNMQTPLSELAEYNDDDLNNFMKSEYGYSVAKSGSDYKVSFESNYSGYTFPFLVTSEKGNVNVKAKYSASDNLTPLTPNASGNYVFSFVSAVAGVNSYEVSVEVVTPTYAVTAPADQAGYIFAPEESFENMESNSSREFKFTITSVPGYRKPTVTVRGGTLEDNSQEVDLNNGTKFTYTVKEINQNLTISYTGGKQTYTVTLSEKTGYRLTSSNGGKTIEHGGFFDFYVTPLTGYKAITEGDINVNSGSVTTLSTNFYRLSGVTTDVTISLSENAGKQTYTVTPPETLTGYKFAAEDNYTNLKSDEEGNFKFSITVETGYKEPNVRVSSGSLSKSETSGNKYTYTVSGITQNIAISFTGGKESYTVTFDTVNGYALTPASSGDTIEYGGRYNFYVTPQPGYKAVTVSNIKVKNAKGTEDANGTVSSLGNNQYQLSGVTENVKITLANVGEETYSITLPSGTGYSVSVEDNQDGITKNTENVSYISTYGKTFKFKITLNTGYTNSQIVVSANGRELTGDNGDFGANTKQYTISNITSNQQITVSGVTKNTFNVRLISTDTNQGYTLTTTDSTSQIPYESTFHFTLTVKDGYTVGETPSVIATVNENDAPVVTVTPRAGSDTVYDCTLNVTNNITGFTVTGINAKTYTVTVQKEGEGFTLQDANGTSKTNIGYNGNYNFTVTAKLGYRLVSVSVGTTTIEGAPMTDLSTLSSSNGVYYISGITTNKTIVVEVEKVTLTVTYNDSLNEDNPSVQVKYTVDGVTINDEETEDYGSVDVSGNVSLPSTAKNEYNQYYQFDGWFDGANKKEGSISLGNTDASLTLTAQWTPKWEEIFTLKWDPNANNNDGGSLTVKYTPDKRNIVPALEGAKITKVGMYYAQNVSDLSSEQLESLKKEFIDTQEKIKNERSVRQTIVSGDKKVILYVYVTDYTDITAWTSFEQGFTNVKTDRYAVGWIELTLKDGSKQYIYTNLETIPKG